jgi:hypothetical protein
MKTFAQSHALIVVTTILWLSGATAADATPIILNGGFEAGFTSWTHLNQLGSEGDFFIQTGTTSPINGDPVPAPPGGSNAAMTDAAGPGSHVLFQDFVASPGILSFSLFVGNRADRFATPATLDFSTPALNQRARVDIMRTTADPFSIASADILMNLFETPVGGPLVSGYTTLTINLTALLGGANLGQTLRLRFAETDNLAPFQFGVDNVAFAAAPAAEVPEPASLILIGTGFAALGLRRRRAGK